MSNEDVKIDTEAEIGGWSFLNFETIPKILTLNKMKVIIENNIFCEYQFSTLSYKNFNGSKHMCGTPMEYHQKVSFVINNIKYLTYGLFITFLKIDALKTFLNSWYFYLFCRKIVVVL